MKTLQGLLCTVQQEIVELHPYASLFWQKKQMLLVSDTHFGKVSHFRKNGMAVPMAVAQRNWDRLMWLIDHYKPKELVFLGDLFHSSYNEEWNVFQTIRDSFYEVQMTLVLGNHDILNEEHYQRADLRLVERLDLFPFVFSHEPLDRASGYNIYGHIHPAVRMKGKGRQSMKLPCFYFGEKYGIMPAFGAFTGTMTIPVKEGDQVFVLAQDQVFQID